MTVKSLTPITDDDLLKRIKTDGHHTGEYNDGYLREKMEEIKLYLLSAGVREDVLGSTLAVGCISRGVADLIGTENGEAKLSEYFYQRAEQLRGIEVADNG